MKGKQHLLNDDNDVSMMYAEFEKKKYILLKCLPRLKRPSSKSDLESAPNHAENA